MTTADNSRPALPRDPNDALIVRSFARFAPVALGVACGAVLGAVLLAATGGLVLKGGEEVGPTLALLSEYFPGYAVTGAGSVLGAIYGFVAGFGIGWLFAVAHNVAVRVYLYLVQLKANLTNITGYIDPDHAN